MTTASSQTSPVALVTGGSRGLGRSTALALAQRGVDVILTYQSRAHEAETVCREIEVLGRTAAALKLDVADSGSFSAFADEVRASLAARFGRAHIHALVNNAGIGINTPFADTTEDEFDLMVNIHVKGPFFLTQTLLPLIADGGRVVNLSSGLARFSLPGFAAYGTMKGAVDTLTRYMALELGARGIRVNSVAPGAIETDFGGGAVRDNADFNRLIAQQTALGRVGLPDDIGRMIASLISDDFGWVNGQRIEVSGGIHL